LNYIPPGQTLYYYYEARDGPAGEFVKCQIDVLYGYFYYPVILTDEQRCTTEGGTWWSDLSACQFSGVSCPSGWYPNGFTGTFAKVCSGTVGECTGSPCTTGSHSFSGVPVEICQYTLGYLNEKVPPAFCDTSLATCSATISSVGCVRQ